MQANDATGKDVSTGKRKKQAVAVERDTDTRTGGVTSDSQRFAQVRSALGQTAGNIDASSGMKRSDFEDTKLSDPNQPKKSRSTA